MLFQRHGRFGALLLGDGIGIIPAAGLCAGAAVAVAPREVVGEQTAAAVGNAHRAVNKGFELNIVGNVVSNGADLLDRQLAGEHDALGTERS